MGHFHVSEECENESKDHNTYLKQHNVFCPPGDQNQESNHNPRLLDSKMYKSVYNHHYQVMYNLKQIHFKKMDIHLKSLHLDWHEIACFILLSFSKYYSKHILQMISSWTMAGGY